MDDDDGTRLGYAIVVGASYGLWYPVVAIECDDDDVPVAR